MKPLPTPIDHDELLRRLRYEPETGSLFWLRNARGPLKRERRAGTRRKDGYLQVGFGGRLYLAHRLIWFIVTGRWPAEELDHKNTRRDDNRFANLREATRSQNQANRPVKRTNASRIKGVRRVSGQPGVWQAYARRQGQIYLNGNHRSAAKAGAAYEELARRVHGEFAHPACAHQGPVAGEERKAP